MPNEGWFLALHHFEDSATLSLPCRLVFFPGTGTKFIELIEIKEVPWKAVCSIGDIECQTFAFKGWHWQCELHANVATQLRPAIRLVLVGSPGGVYYVAANNAFWRVDRTQLQVIAKDNGTDMSGLKSLFDALLHLVKFFLEVFGRTGPS